jgi:multidrug resistance efflux pump
MKYSLLSFALVASLSLLAHGAWGQTLSNPVLPRCVVSAKDEVQVPAQEAGMLTALPVREGVQVRAGDLLGRIDDSERQMEKRQALIEQQGAKEQADNDVNVRYADAAARVAETEYQQAVDANRRVRGTFPEAEVRRLKLAWHRAVLQIEQAQLEQRMAAFTSDSAAADVEAADTNIRRRQIVAPIDGEVVAMLRHAGEWVNPGEPVLRIVRFDTLRIEAFLNAAQFDPGDVAGKPVSVEVALARSRTVKLSGTIVYVSSLVQAGGQYRVWAEVANRRDVGGWLLRPGLDATMEIHVK